MKYNKFTTPVKIEIPGIGTIESKDLLLKVEVDEAIAKLKAENERLKKCEIWMKQHFYCEEVIACESAKNRMLKRALWLARSNKAESEARGWYHFNAYNIKYDGLYNIKEVLYGKGFNRYPEEWIKLWIKIERLCLAKAKEYK